MGCELGHSADEVANLYQADLVHDFGRLGVSNAIWDKPVALGAGEWERVRLHPYFTERMLNQSAGLEPRRCGPHQLYAGLAAGGGVAQYAATQYAMRGVADSLRAEVNRDGVRVLTPYVVAGPPSYKSASSPERIAPTPRSPLSNPRTWRTSSSVPSRCPGARRSPR